MILLRIALRMLFASAVLLLGAVAISVMTRDAWLIVAHTAGAVSAVIAALAVLLLFAAGVRRMAPPPGRAAQDGAPDQRGMDKVSP